MRRVIRFASLSASVFVVAGFVSGQEGRDLERIPNWSAPPLWSPPSRVAPEQGLSPQATEVLPSPALPFVAIAPCRLLDTRPPENNPLDGDGVYTTDEIRTYTLPGACGLPTGIQAVSVNVTAANTGSGAFGHIKVWPADGTEPNVSTLNYPGAGATVANAAVVPLSTAGAMRVKSGNTGADVILDVNGYYGAVAGVFLQLPVPPEIRAGGARFIHSLAPGAASSNAYFGFAAGNAASPGDGNIGIGHATLFNATTGSLQNIGIGHQPLFSLTTGDNNIALGANTLGNVNTGSGNIAFGAGVGSGLSSGSNNLYIASPSAGNESGQIRIGSGAIHTQGTVIAGIHNFGATGGTPVYITSGGRLGTSTASSHRYKEYIRDIASESDGLMSLRPVAFQYREEFDPAGLPQYGLIVEEVARVFPELVECDREGRPEGVRYHQLGALLLNEIQKQHRKLEAQRAEIDELRSRLAKLEAPPSTEAKN